MTLYLLIHNILKKYYALLFAESTTHVFQCRACQTSYILKGPEVKQQLRPKWLIVLPKKKDFRMICPNCQKKTVQEKVETTYN